MNFEIMGPLGLVPFLLRWGHFMAGMTWVGLLYYFNLVQIPFFAETDATVRTGAIRKLVPRALLWFRWGAVLTLLTGVTMIVLRAVNEGPAILGTHWGIIIQLGGLIGTVMFLNVWLIIWPNQRIVIASTESVATGGPANAAAGPAGVKAFLASRTNTVLSIPMIFFMAAASHFPFLGGHEKHAMVPAAICMAVVAVFEANAIFGKKNEGLSKVLEKPVAFIHVGLLLAVVFFLLLAFVPAMLG